MEKIVFIGFVVSAKSIDMNKENVRAIQEWPPLTSITKARSFYGLTSFYKRFVKDLTFT
jgi:hypothetical protein